MLFQVKAGHWLPDHLVQIKFLPGSGGEVRRVLSYRGPFFLLSGSTWTNRTYSLIHNHLLNTC